MSTPPRLRQLFSDGEFIIASGVYDMFSSTRGMAVANAWAALEVGARRLSGWSENAVHASTPLHDARHEPSQLRRYRSVSTPPQIASDCPVMCAPASDARKRAIAATSSGLTR